MDNRTRHFGTLEIIKRLPSSAFGNPRFLIRVGGYTARTMPNCALAFQIENLRGKRVEAILGTHRGVCQVESIHLTS